MILQVKILREWHYSNFAVKDFVESPGIIVHLVKCVLSQEGLLLNGLDLDVLGAQTGVCGVVVEG
jgi:hypothetical protein